MKCALCPSPADEGNHLAFWLTARGERVRISADLCAVCAERVVRRGLSRFLPFKQLAVRIPDAEVQG